MNPVILLVLLFILGNPPAGRVPHLPPIGRLHPPAGPAYIDTFKMELLLDRLHAMTSALEKVSRLNQVQKIPTKRAPSIDRIQESLDAIKCFLADGKPNHQVDSLSQTLSGVKKIGDMEGLMTAMAPILSLINNGGIKQ